MTVVVVSPEGEIRFVHDDALSEALGDLGQLRAARASDVEPVRSPTWGLVWHADLRRVGGPRAVFVQRAVALAWEKDWLEEHDVPRAGLPAKGE